VSDNGPGIDPQTVHHVFDAFSTTKPEGWEWAWRSAVQSLTRTAAVFGPKQMTARRNFSIHVTHRARRSMTATKATVFIVDDDPSIRLALENLVSSIGQQVETYAAAQDFLRDCPRDPAGCLVLDVQMPGLSGWIFKVS
jgi:PleD family two-component response regulator